MKTKKINKKKHMLECLSSDELWYHDGSLALTKQQSVRHPGVQKRPQMVCVRFYYNRYETKQSKCGCRPKLMVSSPNKQEVSAGKDAGAH